MAEDWAAGLAAPFRLPSAFIAIAGPVPPFQVKIPGAAEAIETLDEPTVMPFTTTCIFTIVCPAVSNGTCALTWLSCA